MKKAIIVRIMKTISVLVLYSTTMYAQWEDVDTGFDMFRFIAVDFLNETHGVDCWN